MFHRAIMLPDNGSPEEFLLQIYEVLESKLGDLKWWPAKTPEEVVIGAILVQGVSWPNAVKAIESLRASGLLSLAKIHDAPNETVERCIVSALYYRMKAKKLKSFARHVHVHYGGDLSGMFTKPTQALRQELLGIYGIGPETADDILLYAAQQPSFVVDAYTKRVFHRLGVCRPDIPYEEMRAWFMRHLPHDVKLFNQYHALLDHVGHHFCFSKRPNCSDCPLHAMCAYDGQEIQASP